MKVSPLAFIPYLAMILGLHVFQSAWAAFAIYHGLLLASLPLDRNKPLWKELLKGWNWKVGLGVILFGLGGGVVLFFLGPLAGLNQGIIEPILAKLGLRDAWWLVFVCYHSLVNPWLEEILWRGKLGSPGRRPELNDLLFAGYHLLVLVLFLDWMWMVFALVLLTVAGWLWRQLRRQFGGLLLPAISHLAADASIMAVVFVMSR